jgi:HTTM domain
MAERTIVGWRPWLPWPLCAWRWWTEPVRAERLAALRIGLAAVLLVDIVTSYLPHVQEYFSTAWFGAADIVGWWSESPGLRWSLLRGVSQPLESALLLFCWMTATVLVLAGLAAQLTLPREQRCASFLTWTVMAWLVTTALAVLGFWARSDSHQAEELPLLGPWNAAPVCLEAAGIGWAIAAFTLLVGFFTRTSAVVVWLLTNSFSNLNPYIDNAGDAVRSIVVFYLMLCPCGAAWSLDSWWTRRRNGLQGPIYVSPWPLRLLFIQMVYIYFCNGLAKVFSPSWQEGNAIYYVLSDLDLSRISVSEFPVPALITRLLTWAVLVWEVGFPLWVALPWTRKAALIFGVAFHLGTFATMEIGGFVPYMLVLYLPLLSWGNGRGAETTVTSPS